MTLRTPRRRISPRTRRRYRAIRDFLRRALGNASQADTKTNSNISVNVSELKHKIVGVEKQLDQVSQQCQNLITADDGSTRENHQINLKNDKTSLENIKIKPVETRVLYKTSENQYKNFIESDVTSKASNAKIASQKTSKTTTRINVTEAKNKHKIKKHENDSIVANEIDTNLNSRKKPLNYSTVSYYSSVDLVRGNSMKRHERRPKVNYVKPLTKESQKAKEDEHRNNVEYLVRKYEERMKRKKYRQDKKEIDKDFIDDIIKRQYKPTKLFNRIDSGFSQLSAPLCRDQDFSVHENIQEGSELCSCCYDKPTVRDKIRYTPSYSDVRSICDTRLYSSKRYPRYRQSRRNQEYYNDTLYDLVPVKEKSSPKSRRKFADYVIPYDHYKEVPPSPRSLRPRFNLTAQRHNDFEDVSLYVSRPRQKYAVPKLKPHVVDKNLQNDDFSCISNDEQVLPSAKVTSQNFPIGEYENSLPYPDHNQTNLTLNDLSQDKTQETDATVDKTDKALYEIKDILQTFLEEMKRETLQSDKSDTSDKSLVKRKQEDEKTNVQMFPNSSHSFNDTNNQFLSKTPYVQAFPNPCCYPILPVCPINCVQNGFVIPTQSHTCTACTNHPKEPAQSKEEASGADNASNKTDDTQQLIKEIYNFVKQSPKVKNTEYRDVSVDNTEAVDGKFVSNKALTSRSVGAGSNPSVHDIKVGTSQMKCHSKSCEAFGSKKNTDIVHSNSSYSDTVLEKLSLEAAATQPSDFDFTSILNMKVKPRKKKKFAKVLQSFGNLLKKRKKDVIEELSESESAVEMDVKPLSPYRQHVANYMMHGEEYYHPPPLPARLPHPPRSPEWSYRPSDSRHGYPQSPYAPTIHENHPSYPGTSPSYSNSFDNRYNQIPPQVPLCLKEIEVKSIGTQSERKKSFLEIIRSKMAVPKPQIQIDPIEDAHRNVAQMTRRHGVFNWKNLQEKAMQTNPTNLGLSLNYTQNQFTEADMTIRNTLMKRFFHKRNPFSAQNPLLQTLLGKDKPMEIPTNLFRTKMIV
ncbi:uncharacterized protein [Battus philenor]|uniref:uncharacterized protein n=1 Tax=Battus philenor TaxID=42288 RepID=UPI0035D0F31D